MKCAKEKELRELRDSIIEYRSDISYIKKDIDSIVNNHLAHMQKSLVNMEKQINKINLLLAKWIGAGIVLVAVIDYLIKKY